MCNFVVWFFVLDFIYFLVFWCVRGVLIFYMCFFKFVGYLDGYVILSVEVIGFFFFVDMVLLYWSLLVIVKIELVEVKRVF